MISNSPKIYKLIFAILIPLLCFLTIWLGTLKSPDVNHYGDTNIHTCIHSDDRKLHFKLDAGGGNNFDVYLVENSKQNCLNPYFPSIHIQASQPHNAWVHIVYTDSKAPEWRTFIDAANIDSPGSAYPFYTYEQDFYDAPLWTYSLFNKPLSFWKGHAFAVKVDHQKKSISGIISLKKIYSDEEIDKACERALHYGITSYSKIKNILESNNQNLPLPDKREHKEYIEYMVDIVKDIPGEVVNIEKGPEVNYAKTA